MKKIVITGLGCVSPLGNCLKDTWESIISGLSGINKIKIFNKKYYSNFIVGKVKNFNIQKYISFKEIKNIDKFVHFGLAASIQAINDSNLNFNYINPKKIGIIIGSGFGNFSKIIKNYNKYINNNFNFINPFFISSSIMNIIASQLSVKFNFKGPIFSLSNSCSTGLHCIGIAKNIIKYNNIDIIIAGSSESIINTFGIKSFNYLNVLSKRINDPKTASRPWDKYRDGFVISEGSGILILEEYKHAKNRNANIYAELLGFGINNDAYNILSPNIKGRGSCINLALKDAKLNFNEINYLNAHGASTKIGDKNETDMIKNIFKYHAYKLVINSTKSMTGHLLGASGGLESVLTILAIYNQISPPTINIFNKDPECNLDYCSKEARNIKINFAMKNSFGFGGVNGSLIFKKI